MSATWSLSLPRALSSRVHCESRRDGKDEPTDGNGLADVGVSSAVKKY